MNPKFEVVFLEQAIDFMAKIDAKSRKKVYYNIDKAKFVNDPELFKKLEDKIWEFRTNIPHFNTDFSLFGTKQIQAKHLFWQPMVL